MAAQNSRQLRETTVLVRAELDELRLTVRQILDLVPGDVLPIKSPDNVTVKVSDQTRLSR